MRAIELPDGCYLFRERPSEWWRAVRLRINRAESLWAAGGWLHRTNLEGEFHGAINEDSEDWIEANQDAVGRLFRQPTVAASPQPTE